MFIRFSHSMQHTIPCRLPPFYNSHANNKYSSQSTAHQISFITAVEIIMWKEKNKVIVDPWRFSIPKKTNILALQSGKFVFAIFPIENYVRRRWSPQILYIIQYYSNGSGSPWFIRRRKYLFECEYVNGKINNKHMRKTHKNMYCDEPSDVADEH